MGVTVTGFSGVDMEVEANSRAGRIVQRPDDALGHFQKAMTSGVMAAGLAAAASIFQFRWADATKICLIRRVNLSAGGIVGFTAGVATFNLFPARSFTANGSGGTAGTLTGNNGKLRTSMSTMVPTDIRISSTAALTAGTWTLDTDPVGGTTQSVTATAGVVVLPMTDLFYHGPGLYPLVLVQNEGFTIQATVPATGTWTFSAQVEWTELATSTSYQ
jgi:hypothetical protein